MKWYDYPSQADQGLWRDAVREVALLDDDQEALSWVDKIGHLMRLMYQTGILVGAPKPPPEAREALYAELDHLLGVTQ